MRTVTYLGPARNLRTGSGRLVPRDVPTKVTDADAEALQGRDDVEVHEPDED